MTEEEYREHRARASEEMRRRMMGPNGDWKPQRQQTAEGMLWAGVREGNAEAVKGYVRGMLSLGLDAQAAWEKATRIPPAPGVPPPPFDSYQAVLYAIQTDQAAETDRMRARPNPIETVLAGEAAPEDELPESPADRMAWRASRLGRRAR